MVPPPGGFYNLDNPGDSGISIFGLAVTTESYSPGLEPGTSLFEWDAHFLNPAAWDSRFDQNLFNQTFAETFGTNPEVDGVYMYMISQPPSGALEPGNAVTGSSGFYFASLPDTHFAALNSGRVIAQSFVPTVPIPATLALMGMGLFAAGFARKRRTD